MPSSELNREAVKDAAKTFADVVKQSGTHPSEELLTKLVRQALEEQESTQPQPLATDEGVTEEQPHVAEEVTEVLSSSSANKAVPESPKHFAWNAEIL